MSFSQAKRRTSYQCSSPLFRSLRIAERGKPLAGLLHSGLQFRIGLPPTRQRTARRRQRRPQADPSPRRDGPAARGGPDGATQSDASSPLFSVIRALHRGGSVSGSPLPLPITSLTSMRTTGERVHSSRPTVQASRGPETYEALSFELRRRRTGQRGLLSGADAAPSTDDVSRTVPNE